MNLGAKLRRKLNQTHQTRNSALNSKIKLKPVATRADEIMTSFDANKDGLISRDEFTEGYMKMHTTKTGKRRWSRGIGIWQTKALNMDKIIKGSNSEK